MPALHDSACSALSYLSTAGGDEVVGTLSSPVLAGVAGAACWVDLVWGVPLVSSWPAVMRLYNIATVVV